MNVVAGHARGPRVRGVADGRVVEPARFAGWIAPPATGINMQPVDFSTSGSVQHSFADFHGQVIHCGPATCRTPDHDYARDYDPQWFHTDPQRAAAANAGSSPAAGRPAAWPCV